jgi:hypothetical protein
MNGFSVILGALNLVHNGADCDQKNLFGHKLEICILLSSIDTIGLEGKNIR